MSTSGSAAGTFEPTRWSVVLAAGKSDDPATVQALEVLCRSYWQPLYAYVRRQGYSTHDAQDLTQAYFERLFEKKYLQQVAPSKGRFRAFLLASLKHFLANEADRARAQKRGGQARFVPLHFDQAESTCCIEPADPVSTDAIFEKQWAATLLQNVLSLLEQDYVDAGKGHLFAALKDTLAGPRESIPYSALGATLGMSEGAIKTAVHRLRSRYREILRAEIERTVASPSQVEAELRELFAALSR